MLLHKYYPEIEALLKEITGAEKVVVFDHQTRNIQLSKQGERNAREYVRTGLGLSRDHLASGACGFPGNRRG